MPPFLQVLKIKDFRNLWLGQITSQVAVNMMSFVLVLRIYEKTSSNTAVSLLVLAIGLPAIFFGVLAGTLVDRMDKRNVLIAANLVRMLLLLGFFITAETIFWVYFLVLAISITTQFFVPAEAPTIPRVVPPNLLLTANSLFTFTYYTSVMTGFILSGPALRFFGPHNVFLFLAALLALSAFFVSQISPEGKRQKLNFSGGDFYEVWKELMNGLKLMRDKSEVFEPILLLTASQALIAALVSLAPGFAHQILKVEVKDASYLIMGPAAVGMVSGSLLVGQYGRKISSKNLINSGIVMAGIFLILLSAVVKFTNLPLAMMILLMIGGANALIDVPANTSLQANAPAAIRGRVYGVLTSLVGGAAILPVVMIGVAADLFGVGKVILAIAIVILAVGIYRVVKERYN